MSHTMTDAELEVELRSLDLLVARAGLATGDALMAIVYEADERMHVLVDEVERRLRAAHSIISNASNTTTVEPVRGIR